ncbi:MAG: Hsp70 family protein [Myxococcales bacterium]|nr:Hsp70 family protein [Myxococcales bacterium]
MSREQLVLGIDFGTSFSSAAAWVNGKLFLVPDERGEPCIPSALFIPRKGPPIVGFRALQLAVGEPQLGVRGLKRILGRSVEDPAVRLFEAQNAARVKAGPRGLILRVAQRDFAATQLAAEVFRTLKSMAEARFRLPAEKAVVTLPTAADRSAQDAVVEAARLAGIEVVQTVPEPTAAAVAYGLDRSSTEDRRLLIYDFGGGTFDVTVLRQVGTQFTPLALGGDPLLGGDDLDEALARLVGRQVWTQYRLELDKDVVRWQRVLLQSEAVKRALSGTDEIHLRIRDLFTAGPLRDLDLPVSRADANQVWQEYVERTLQVTARTMMQANMRPKDVDEVVLVGGSTYIPMVQQRVAKMMGRPGERHSDPQTAVAAGAAILAARVLRLAA